MLSPFSVDFKTLDWPDSVRGIRFMKNVATSLFVYGTITSSDVSGICL